MSVCHTFTRLFPLLRSCALSEVWLCMNSLMHNGSAYDAYIYFADSCNYRLMSLLSVGRHHQVHHLLQPIHGNNDRVTASCAWQICD